MQKLGKRILSMVLALCLCLLLMPAFAAPVEAASNAEIRTAMIHMLYNGKGGYMSCDFDGYVNTKGRHEGIDFCASGGAKSAIYSLTAGVVTRVTNSSSLSTLAIYDEANGVTVLYLHGHYTLSAGERVQQGQYIGYEWNHGASGAHTHVEVRNGRQTHASKSVNDYTLDNANPYPYWGKIFGGTPPCQCSEQYAGTYICTTTQKPLTIRSNHSTNSAATGHSIPPGAEVTVTKASGTGKNDWAHVIYNGQSGYASMEYLKLKEDKPQQERDSRMALWFSNTEHGDGISSSRTGEQVYLCYKFYDANTGDMFDTYNPHSYKAILRIYQPDGSELGSWDFSDDRSWVRMVPKTPGTYKGELYFKFDIGGEKTITTNIEIKYEPRVTASYTELLFEIPSVESHTVTISYSGAFMSKSVRVKCLSVDDCVKYEWGTWENHQMPLTITGVRAGDGEIEIGLFDGDTDELLATTKILVSVTAPTYTITYHVNGGSPTPEPQIKYHNVPLTLTDVIPHQKGHTFVGWSLVEGKNILLYKAGEIYTLDSNKDLDLYAYWKQGCEQDAHEWKPASCEAAKTCTICGQTDGQPLGHQWEKATCEKAETCKACGKTNGEPLGHNWVDATCEAAKTCSVCKKTEGEPVGHKWVEAGCNTAKTCSVCQKKDGEPLGHKYENGTCIRCGLSQCADNGHKWADATCEKPKTCSVCKKTEGEPLNHKWADATCEKAKTCSVCNKIEGDPLGHDWVAATCETAATCSRCGKIDGEPLGHAYVDGVCTRCKAEDPDHQKVARGDMNKDGQVNSDDALYLLRNSMNPDRYPIEQNGDVNGDGIANSDDAIYLLRHTMSPERYPLP